MVISMSILSFFWVAFKRIHSCCIIQQSEIHYMTQLKQSLSDTFMYFMSSITNRGTFKSFRLSHLTETYIIVIFMYIIIYLGVFFKKSIRSIGILAFAWCFVSFVIVNAYNSTVISYLSLSFKKPDVSTFHELAYNSNFQVTTIESTICEIDIMVKIYNYLFCWTWTIDYV